MATAQISCFLRRLTRGMAAEGLAEHGDRDLVERLLAGQDETAFETLVHRHGPMVYRVCWRVLQNAEDSEDAFQATFLLLGRKLRTVRKRDSLASWLHGVAHRVALNARVQGARRRRHERSIRHLSQGIPDDITWRELRTVLDAELTKLPEKLRLPLILCYLEGRPQEESARQLGWSKSTLLRRLQEGRAALGRRLTRRGVVWSAALSAVLLSDCVAPAALAPRLLGSTVEAAAFIAAGKAAPAAAVSARVAALTEGVLKTMFTSKLKIATAALVLVSALAVGAGGLLYQTQAAELQPPAQVEKPPATQEAGAKGTTPAPKAGELRWQPRLTIHGHHGWASYVEISPDGKSFATFDPSRSELRFWDTTWKEIAVQPLTRVFTHGGAYHLSLFAPGGKMALVEGRSADKDGQPAPAVALLDVPSGTVHALLPGGMPVFSKNGKTLALGRKDAVTLYDLPAVKERLTLRVSGDWTKPPKGSYDCYHLWFSPDGKALATSWNGIVKLWDAATGKERASIPGYLPVLNSQTPPFSPDGSTLATAKDGTVRLWDVATGKQRRAGTPQRAAKTDPKELARLIAELDREEFAVRQKAAKDLEELGEGAEEALAQALTDGKMSLEARRRVEPLLTKLAGPGLGGHQLPCLYVVFSPDGKTLATVGGWFGPQAAVAPPDERRGAPEEFPVEVKLWDVKTTKALLTLPGNNFGDNRAHFSPDGKTLAYHRLSSAEPPSQCVALWDLEAKKARAVVPGDHPGLFSPDGKLLMIPGRTDGDMHFWDTANGKLAASIKGEPGRQLVFFSFSPEWGTLITSAFQPADRGAETRITVWEFGAAR